MNNVRIKEWCSCIRNMEQIQLLENEIEWTGRNTLPEEGDLVLVKVVHNGGAYDRLENRHGRDVRLYPGDHVVCVLGTRRSGTNLSGTYPRQALEKGMELELLSVGGIIGKSDCVPSYYGREALTVTIESFPSIGGKVLNTISLNAAKETNGTQHLHADRIVWVGGTSAESGKTTFLCHSVAALKRLQPSLKIGALKVAGTGRLKDMLCYKDAGAALVGDYVDEGWPSTYSMSGPQFLQVLHSMLKKSYSACDIVFAEIGGDLIEAGAPAALDFCLQSKYPFYLLVNDAMGAITGLDILKTKGITNVKVCTFKQNAQSLARRLGLMDVIDTSDLDSIRQEFNAPVYGTV